MRSKPVETQKDFKKDIETFAHQPSKNKELAALADESERTVGKKKVAANERANRKAKG